MWNLKNMIQRNLFINRNRLIDLENEFTVTRGKGVGRDRFGVWN